MQETSYKIEYIKWVDSFGCSAGWGKIEPIDTLLICHSVGFVIYENEHTVSLANSVAEETKDTMEQANGVMTIPKCCIKERFPMT